MMKGYQYLLFCFLLGSCAALKQKSKSPLDTGIYNMKAKKSGSTAKVYVTITNDTAIVYPLVKKHHGYVADTTHTSVFVFPQQVSGTVQNKVFSSHSLDIDVLTIAFKYRPSVWVPKSVQH